MKDQRSSSQILFGFLPQQTVDVRGGIWKVKEWRSPHSLGAIDSRAMVKELKRVAAAWRNEQTDGNFVSDLERGSSIHVHALDRNNGVSVEPFPTIWYCKNCRRLYRKKLGKCPCGSTAERSQMHFVAFHDKCGTIREPRLPKCPQHDEAIINFPGTASAKEITFSCPKCSWSVKGFPHTNCTCGNGALSVNVHRSSTVFTPRDVVIVNPPRRDDVQKIMDGGGSAKALSWVVDGMQEASVHVMRPTASSLSRQLEQQGLPKDVVEQMVLAARNAGSLQPEDDQLESVPADIRTEAEDQALAIALAASASRRRIADLVVATDPTKELGMLYRADYPKALARAHIDTVELIDKFPVLTGHFGFTRGDPQPGKSRLVTYKDKRGDYVVYGDLMETEALFFRLSALQVAQWLRRRGFALSASTDERSARLGILSLARIPHAGDSIAEPTVGSEVLTLLHSLCHRVIRLLAVRAGIERSALSEFLVPLHLGFYVYAAVRGDFVLGGLQAVFESELDALLDDVVFAERRCALDPGCSRAGGACMSCLHLGEPSCRYWNTFLDRRVLFGRNGFYRDSASPVQAGFQPGVSDHQQEPSSPAESDVG